jgi:hypothetical protein
MPKSPYEKAIEKQIRESKKLAEETSRRDRAKSIIEGQPIKNGFRVMDGNAEQLLRVILGKYDGRDSNEVSGGMELIPDNLHSSFNLELEKLLMYGAISSKMNYISGWRVVLSPNGKTYFDDKEISEIEQPNIDSVFPKRKQYDVFISHANKDKLAYVDSLYISMRKLGIRIFYDSEELSWGDDWKNVIYDGVEKSEFAVVVISKDFFGREWTERELNELLQRQNETGQKIILPLLYELSYDDLKANYPELESIQSIKSSDKTLDEITILLAKELIKRYK